MVSSVFAHRVTPVESRESCAEKGKEQSLFWVVAFFVRKNRAKSLRKERVSRVGKEGIF